MNPTTKWLIFEGLIPLFGAAFIYTFWGACRFVVATNKSIFKYGWKQALDPLGWLYGAVIIAFQSGLDGITVTNAGIFPYTCFAAALACFFLLMAAMTERGQSSAWQPPISLQLITGVLVLVILFASFKVQVLLLPGV